ncbi:MAG: hypothetical protein QOI53_3834 [Verrucomicrobiota bacterium]|nr:hypothetical protein [Verrucomicrobiota bacterium]
MSTSPTSKNNFSEPLNRGVLRFDPKTGRPRFRTGVYGIHNCHREVLRMQAEIESGAVFRFLYERRGCGIVARAMGITVPFESKSDFDSVPFDCGKAPRCFLAQPVRLKP